MFTLPNLKMMTAALALSAGAAFAAVTPEQIAANYTTQGFTRVEIRTGLTQTKVEAIRGTEKREVIIDTATGNVLKTETETVGAFENTTPGVFVRNRNRDFVRVNDDDNGQDDDSSDDDNGIGNDDRDESDDDHDNGSGNDDRDDDNGHGGNSGPSGGNDDEDDDGGDDHGGNSGHGGGGSDDDDDSRDD